MKHPVISVESLSKRFRFERHKPRDAREALEYAFRSPLRGLRGPGSAINADSPSVLWALRDVSFEVDEGEALAIVGRNGAGKSVLLKILARVTRPTSGRAVIRGRLAPLLEVGTGFHPELTGRENIYLNGTIFGMREKEVRSRLDEIIAFSKIEDFLDSPVKHYSDGMRMRLAFAVAAHLDREIFLLDEVFAVGDIGFQSKCIDRLRELRRKGRTILFVSHGDEGLEFCSRAILLDHGHMIASGRPTEIDLRYRAMLGNADLAPHE